MEDQVASSSTTTAPPTDIKVYKASNIPTNLDELPDEVFEHSPADVKNAYAAAQSRLQANQVLRTSAMRAKDEKPKATWSTTKIRIKFPSSRTQLERSFPSNSTMPAVYAFVRECLAEDRKSTGFMLYQPPRQNLPEFPTPPPPASKRPRPPPEPEAPQTLQQLGLSPSSVLNIRFDEDSLNAQDAPPPLLASLLNEAEDLPLPSAAPPPATQDASVQPPPLPKTAGGGASGKVPKWFKKGK